MKKTDLDLVEHIDHRTEERLKKMRFLVDHLSPDAADFDTMKDILFTIMDEMSDEIDARQEQRFHENWLES